MTSPIIQVRWKLRRGGWTDWFDWTIAYAEEIPSLLSSYRSHFGDARVKPR